MTTSDAARSFKSSFPGLATPRTTRTHCIVWSDWASGARMAGRNGVRLDANYYYWPAAWVLDRPGMFTGSGFPMRFADLDGSLIDVYQAATQLTDESEIDYAKHIKALLDGALGSQGYYGVFTANMHTDQSNVGDPGAPAIVAEAKRAACRSCPPADARLARRPQRLVLRRPQLQREPAAVLDHARRRRRPRAPGDAAARRTVRRAHRRHARRRAGRDHDAHGQGRRLRGVRRRRRRLHRDVRRRAAAAPGGAGDDDHRLRADRDVGAGRLHDRHRRARASSAASTAPRSPRAPTRSSTRAWPPASTRSRSGPSPLPARPTPRRPSAASRSSPARRRGIPATGRAPRTAAGRPEPTTCRRRC